jgi:hypothetical protein
MSFASNHVIERADGRQRKLCGYKYAGRPDGARDYATDDFAQEQLPGKVDLRTFMSDVENQGQLNSCVANAVAGAYEYLAKRHLGEDSYDVSRLFLYYNARARSGLHNEDSGSMISDAIDSLKEQGACSEQTWPYDEPIVNEQPADDAYAEAAGFVVQSSELVPTDLYAWKHALAEGYPIVFGCLLFDSFDAGRKGKIPMPTPNEQGREEHGGHAMLCVGYSDKDRVFIVRNSWGTEWGDRGYCYMPYDYLMSPTFNSGDSWIIRRLDNFDPNAAWSASDDGVLLGLDEGLALLGDDEYGALLDAMGDYPLEQRLGLIMLNVSGADGEIAEEELANIGEYLARILYMLGIDARIDHLLRNCLQLLEDEELLNESVALLGAHLPPEILASITNDAMQLAAGDGLSEEEGNFAMSLAQVWQIAR